MSRRKIVVIAVAVLFVLTVLGAVGGALGYLAHRERQTAQWHADAEAAFARGDWDEALRWYQWYLPRRGDDIEALKNYAHVNLQMVNGRRSALQRAVTAYHQILRHEPDQREVEDELLDLYVKMRSWPTIEYYTREYLAVRPDDMRLRRLLADALAGAGRGAEAVDAYAELVRDGITDTDMLRNFIDLLRDRNESTRAALMLDDVLETHPGDAGVRAVRAYFFAAQRDWAAMETELQEGLALDSDHPFFLQMQAQYGVATQQYSIARDYGERALEQDPENPGNYTLLAHVYSRMGENDQALELLSNVDPLLAADHSELLIALAELQIGMERYDEAQETRERYIRINPNQRPIADYLQARELLAQGEADEAAAILTTVSELRPGFSPARFYLALAHLTAGNTSRGRSALESYVSQHQGDERARALLAQETRGSVSLEERVAEAQTLLNQEPITGEQLVASALTLFDSASISGEWDEHQELVIDLLNRAIDVEPQGVIGYRGLAEVYTVLGDFDAAQETIERAVDNQVPEQDLFITRASVAMSQGDVETSMAYFDQFSASDAFDPMEVIRWATLFSRKGLADAGIDVLSQSMEQFDGDDGLQLAIERVRAAVRADRLDEAHEWLVETAALVPSSSPLTHELNDARLDLAERSLQEQDEPEKLQLAEGLIDEAMDSDEEHPRAMTLTGQMMLAAPNPDVEGAMRLFENVLEIDSNNTGAHLGLARVALSRGETGSAATHLERAVSVSPNIPWYRLQLAEVYVRLGRHAEARRLLGRVLDDQPENPAALELMVSSLLAMGDHEDAQRYFDRLLVLTQDDPEQARRLEGLRGGMLIARGESEAAVELIQEQLADDPDNFGIAQSLASALINANRADDAVELLREFLDRNRSSIEGWTGYARLLLRRDEPGDMTEASRALTQALLIEPDYLPALREQIDVQVRRGNDLQALTLCDRYLARNPNDTGVLALKARLLARDPAGAEEAIEIATQVLQTEERPELLHLRGSLLFAENEFGQSLQDFQRLAQIQPQTPANVDLMMARAHIESGRRDLASVFFNAAERKVNQGEPIDSALLRSVERDLRSSGESLE